LGGVVGFHLRTTLFALGFAAVMMWPAGLWPSAADVNVGDSAAADDAVPEVEREPMVFVERLICRRERVLGSNLPQRVCRTQTEMVREREAARDLLQREERSYPSATGER
jgi:hypothetical protein